MFMTLQDRQSLPVVNAARTAYRRGSRTLGVLPMLVDMAHDARRRLAMIRIPIAFFLCALLGCSGNGSGRKHLGFDATADGEIDPDDDGGIGGAPGSDAQAGPGSDDALSEDDAGGSGGSADASEMEPGPPDGGGGAGGGGGGAGGGGAGGGGTGGTVADAAVDAPVGGQGGGAPQNDGGVDAPVAADGPMSGNDASQDSPAQDTSAPNADGPAGGSDVAVPPDAFSCLANDQACSGNSSCCSGMCDVSTAKCKANVSLCAASGQACAVSTDCCNLSCVGSVCATATSCTADNAACQMPSQCCSGTCASGACQALNTSCKTAGNPCMTGTECCSKYCKSGTCALGASYCIQPGDVCYRSTDCCTGLCNMAAGASAGTCVDLATSGAGNCVQDGITCGDCTNCCSRVCGPYALSGVKICQPASGCRVTNNLCQKNSDCCGGTGSAGNEGSVNCDIASGVTPPVGACSNPTGCQVRGNVCGLRTGNSICGNAREACCDCQAPKWQCCKTDEIGVPRCFGGSTTQCPTGYTGKDPCCIKAGNTCSFSSECCGGVPCVPDAVGTLRCLATACVPTGGACTNTGDCCTGLACNIVPGQPSGTCGSTSATCALYGQSCSSTVACCGTVPCSTGDGSGAPCAAGETGCSCYRPD